MPMDSFRAGQVVCVCVCVCVCVILVLMANASRKRVAPGLLMSPTPNVDLTCRTFQLRRP